jgi:hypothetical protein
LDCEVGAAEVGSFSADGETGSVGVATTGG